MGFPRKNTGVGCHFLFQGIFLTQGSNPCLLHCRRILSHLSYQEGILNVYHMDFPGDLVVKNPPAMQETQVRSLGREDPLEKKIATHSSIFAWEVQWTEEPGKLLSMGLQKNRTQLSD